MYACNFLLPMVTSSFFSKIANIVLAALLSFEGQHLSHVAVQVIAQLVGFVTL